MRWFIILFIIPARGNFIETPQNITSSPCSDRYHLFLAPGVLTSGGTSRTCVSRFYPEGPARMVLTLLTEDGQSSSATRDLTPGDGGCLDISVPEKPNTRAELSVNIRYPDANCSWDRRISLRIASGKIVVVHTDRARYRPGDLLRIRAIVLKADLTPAHSNFEEIWVSGPRGAWDGVRVAQWARVRSRLGVAQAQHRLDGAAPPGRWTLRARLADGAQGSTTFLVGNYELPPFQLTVNHSPKILRTSERLVWTVCVRYPWSEAVEGMLVIRLRGVGGSGEGTGGIRTAVRLKAPRACHRHAAASKRIGLDGDSSPDVVVADFSFQEEGTRIWQNTTVVSHVVDDAVTLEFLTKHSVVISPGLPYKIKVKATRWDDKPATNESVRMCRAAARTLDEEFNSTSASCVDSITDWKGIAKVMFTAEDDGSPYYIFQARARNATARLGARGARGARGGGARAALGALRADRRARTLLPLYLALPDAGAALTVHFVVITRGGIIYRWGATTQCPITSTTNVIQTSPRNSVCPNTNLVKLDKIFDKNLDARNSSKLDALMDRHLSKIMLPIKVSHQMCPDSHLVAYFYYKNELITASKHFELEECFANKVEARWASRHVSPGSLSRLHVQTPGPALCALSVLEAGAAGEGGAAGAGGAAGLRADLLAALRVLVDANRNLTEHDAAGECFLTSDTPDVPTSGIELMSSWLSSAGVRLLGGGNIVRHCGPSPAKLVTEDVIVPRSDFSESWLWRLVGVGANGSVVVSARAPDSITRYEATAICLAKSGIAISEPAVLQVFRQFFIHATGPQRMKRGDSIIVPYRIFNYLYEPLSIEVEVVAERPLEAPGGAERVCAGPRAAVARRAWLRAGGVGGAGGAGRAGAARVRLRARAAPGACAPAAGTFSGSASDEVVIRIEVDPEGVPVQEHRSALLCGQDSQNFTSIPEMSWSWPEVQAVAGTESVTVWATGDTFGPLLADADGLVQLPRGCGEQNMARLATNLLALQMMTPGHGTLSAKDHVARGVTRQLQYAHPEGGFSAFGTADPQPSAWLTAFCLRYLRRAYEVISGKAPVPPVIIRSERWLASRQMENGCFRPDGHVFHHELQGGLNEDSETSNVALTAYIIIALLESTSPLPPKLIKNSLSCLRALPPSKSNIPNPSRIYAHSIITYAFMRLRRYEESRSNEAGEEEGLKEDEELQVLMEFLSMAKRNGEYVWWDTGNPATSVEASGYALAALAQCGAGRRARCARDVAPAARWLAAQLRAAGGFGSTQDTLVALEGLALWRDLLPSASNVTIKIRSGSHSDALQLTADSTVPKLVKLPASQQTTVAVEGPGCALVQATRVYHSAAAPGTRGSVRVRVSPQGAFHCAHGACYCAALLQVCVMWTDSFPPMSLLEVSLPSGYAPDAERLYAQLTDHTLLRRIELSPNSGKVSMYLGSRDGSDTVSRVGRQCVDIHVVGPKARTKPAYVKIIDYYRPDIKDTQMYTIPEDCPSQISENTSNYHASDNLFNEARSLTDSGEIVISHEYSFEDLPGGFPLEDPMYENLIKNNDYNTIKDIENENSNQERVIVTIDQNTDLKADDVTEKTADAIKNTKENIERNTTKEIDLSTEAIENKHEFKGITEVERANVTGIKEELKQELPDKKLSINNPSLSTFHVIDSEKDLDFPTGVEGPIPAVVLPPKNFVVPPETDQTIHLQTNWRSSPAVLYDQEYYDQKYHTENKADGIVT
ncbi:alpha-2-macroglobulin-P-like [Nymphalis io]|uniref:alpha-2-macroglobulin-P-like n=1 Tax=Inachis io TaxID=171585 RepID=UPI00216A7754|nr:alpha-2-macroglobulin-P-like [Nymphalis io]